MEPLTKKDLRRFKESTRRRLYDMLVESIFGAFNEKEEAHDLIDVSPDDVELQVIWIHRRWFGKYILPKTKSKRFRGESRWILLRLYLSDDGKLMQDEV